MREKTGFLLCIIYALFLSCGSDGGFPSSIEGPVLDINEAKALVVDHFYVNGGLDDEFSSQGEFAIYLRDVGGEGKDLTCASGTDGISQLATPGVYYGMLDIPMQAVNDDKPDSAARFQIVVVEKDSENCPEPISRDDDIVGMSEELTFEELTNAPIWTANGLSSVTLRVHSEEEISIPALAPSLTTGLFIDKLFFDSGADARTEHRYFLFATRIDSSGNAVQNCQVDDKYLLPVKFGNILYAGLHIPIECFSSTDPEFSNMIAKLSLFIQKTQGPELVAETETKPIGEMIGERLSFKNGKGFISFQSIATKAFETSVVRLADVTSYQVRSLTYSLAPSANATVEVHFFGDNASYSFACSGAEQGLTSVNTPANYSNLNASLVASTGQKELFCWKQVTVKLLERTDGLKCPAALAKTPTTLAETSALTPSALAGGNITFLNGGGTLQLTPKP